MTKLSADFNDDEWRKFSTNSLVKKWSGASQDVAFSAPKPDPGLVDLHFQDQKDLEKQLVAAQKTTGAAGAVSTKILERIEGQYCKAFKTSTLAFRASKRSYGYSNSLQK